MDFSVVTDAVLSVFDEAIPVTFTRPAGVLETVPGIFDSRYFEVIGGEQVGVSELVTTLAVRSDVIAARGTEVVVRGITYKVKDIRPDSEGMKVLELERAPDA